MRAPSPLNRRAFMAQAGLGLVVPPALAAQTVDLALPGGPVLRPLTHAFPQKGAMILQRTRPPLLETPYQVFDKGVFTPNDQFYVRWHWALIPDSIDTKAFRLSVHGHVDRPLSLSLPQLMKLPAVEIAAVNQCSGNSRGLFQPRVPGAQWAHGAMGNARWTGVRLRDVLDDAGVKAGAVAVRFAGLDEPLVDGAPKLRKSLSVDHARSDEVIIAYAMNGAPLPLLNGFPIRLVVPGWYATYWIKMLSDIEVLDKPDDSFWMAQAYTIPDTPHADIRPGQAGVNMVPINRMVPRAFITSPAENARVRPDVPAEIRGLAMGGDCGVAKVDISRDDGKTWHAAALGRDEGAYSFRRFSLHVALARGPQRLMARCTNTKGEAQPMTANWNPSGFMRNVVESVRVIGGEHA